MLQLVVPGRNLDWYRLDAAQLQSVDKLKVDSSLIHSLSKVFYNTMSRIQVSVIKHCS
jgi:hypothetical protein